MRFERPALLKAINLLGQFTSFLGGSKKLDADRLIKTAKKKTNLSANVEQQFIPAMEKLIDAMNNTSHMDYCGLQFAKQTFLAALSNQILIQNAIQQDPGILDEKIEKPLIIVGFPRTGTTFIQNMLAQDGQNRTPHMWEVLSPTVVSGLSQEQKASRIKEAEKFVKFADYLIPHLKSIHELQPDGPDECLKLLENSFVSPHFSMYFDAPDYWDWIKNQDNTIFDLVYQYHRKQLQILQRGSKEKRWVLKTPIHQFFIDSILRVYPDACIINMQRDPLECIPSFCSLLCANRTLFTNKLDLNQIGQFSLEFYIEFNRRSISALQNSPQNSFINIQYQDFVTAPYETVKNIYHHFGLTFSDEFESNMRNWVTNNPKGKHGGHEYTLEEFGLTQVQITAAHEKLYGNITI